jgi:hypothetical protein
MKRHITRDVGEAGRVLTMPRRIAAVVLLDPELEC